MNKDVNTTNSGKISVLIDFSILTSATKVYHTTRYYKCMVPRKNTLEKYNKQNTGYFDKNYPKLDYVRPKPQVRQVSKKQGCDFIQYNSSIIHSVALLSIICSVLIAHCEGRLFENPHGNQRGILGGHGNAHPQFSGIGILGRDQHHTDEKKDDPKYLVEEERRRKMLKEYGVDGVVNVQDIGPDGKRRKKVRLGPIVFDPEAIRFDDLDDYNEYNDGPRSKIGRYDYEANEDSVDRDRLVPSRNGGGLNIINKLIVSLFNFGSFLYKLFGNIYRYMEKHAKILNDRMAEGVDQQLPDNEEDHGETSLIVIAIASWLIFGIIVALITYVVNYWSEFVVGNDDTQEIQRIIPSEGNVRENGNIATDQSKDGHRHGVDSTTKRDEDTSTVEKVPRTIPTYSPRRTNQLIISPKLGNRSRISKYSPRIHAAVSLPWIPVIGLVCPEESVLYKKLIHTFNCSNDEEAQLSKDNRNTECIPSVKDKTPSETATSNHKNHEESKKVDLDSDEHDMTCGDKTKIFGSNTNEDTIKEILYNSIVLEKVMQQWRDTLNKKSEILAKRTQTKHEWSLRFLEVDKHAPCENIENPKLPDTSKNTKPIELSKRKNKGCIKLQKRHLEHSNKDITASAGNDFEGVEESIGDNEGADSTLQVSQENIVTPNHIKISNVSFSASRQDSTSQEHLEEKKDDMCFVTFDSEGIFNLRYDNNLVSCEENASNSKLDTNCNATEVEYTGNDSSGDDYTACIKAQFQGYISVVSRHNNNNDDMDDNNHCSSTMLFKTVEAPCTDGKLSISANEDEKLLTSSRPLKKNISNSTGFLKEINGTEVLDIDDKRVSSRSVNLSDIKSYCDFSVATVCFCNIKCFNSVLQYIRRTSSETADTVEGKSTLNLESSIPLLNQEENAKESAKITSSKLENLVSEALSLLKKEIIIDSLKIVIPLRNQLSKSENAKQGKNSSLSALFEKQPSLAPIKDGNTSSKQIICDKEIDSVDYFKETSPISDTATISSKNMSTLTVTIEQVSYSTLPTSRSISPTNDPSNQDVNSLKHEKSTESCLTSESDLPRTNINSTVSFDSTTGFWQKGPCVHLKLDYPNSQNIQTTVADTNQREMDEHREETQSFAWANPQKFDFLISPSRTRELLIEVKDPGMNKNSRKSHSHFFCIISVRDLLTTSNQKHVIPLLSFCRASKTSEEPLTPLTNQQVSDIDKLSDSIKVSEKPSYHYHYSASSCHQSLSEENTKMMNHTSYPNEIDATVTLQFHYKPKSPASRNEVITFSPDRPWQPPPLASVNKTFKAKWDTQTYFSGYSQQSDSILASSHPSVTSISTYILRPEVQQNLNKEFQNQMRSSKYNGDRYGQRNPTETGNAVNNQSQEKVLDEDKPTPIDVAIAATRDLHIQQAKGYGAFALRSVMLIRYSQKQSPLSISSSKTSLVSGGVEKSASNSTISTIIKNKVASAAACNSPSASSSIRQHKSDNTKKSPNEDETLSVSNTSMKLLKDSQGLASQVTTGVEGGTCLQENSVRKRGGLFSTISTIKSKLVSRKRSHSASPKEGRKWRSKIPLKRILPKYGRRQVDFRASTSELPVAAGHKIGTIFEASSTNRKNDNRSERHENSGDSNSICSFTHSSCDSMSEASYELTPWHGKLSMSWESIGPDAMSSTVFLAPQATCNISDEASTFSDISTTSVTGAVSENAPPSAFKHFPFSGAECTTTATGASSSSTSMPEDQQNITNLSIGEDSEVSEGSKLPTYNITTVSAQASRHQSGSGNIKTTSSSKSWLVLETLEQPLNFTRHYLMPNQIEKRWRKRDWSSQKLRGTRLHIFMDHVFVSKRIKSGSNCAVCQKSINIRIGRKCYSCRDCGFVCHKICHTKTDVVCPKTSVNSMELFRGSTIMKRRT